MNDPVIKKQQSSRFVEPSTQPILRDEGPKNSLEMLIEGLDNDELP